MTRCKLQDVELWQWVVVMAKAGNPKEEGQVCEVHRGVGTGRVKLVFCDGHTLEGPSARRVEVYWG